MTSAVNSRPTLTLCIPVYRGGEYWRQCWDSVRPLAKLFDRVLISFNYSETQLQDRAVIGDDLPEDVECVLQPLFWGPVQHFVDIASRLDTDYVLLLCHDDWLLEDGLNEVLVLLCKHAHENVAVFGSHAWSETDSTREGVTRQLAAFPDGIDVSEFVKSDLDNGLSISLSGLVTPVPGLRECIPMVRLFTRGYRMDNFVITYPGIRRVLQTVCPIVKVRIHEAQQGRIPDTKSLLTDNMTYFFIQTIYSAELVFTQRLVSQMMSFALHASKRHALKHLIKLCVASLSWKGPKHYWSLFMSEGRWLFQVLSGKLKRTFCMKRRS